MARRLVCYLCCSPQLQVNPWGVWCLKSVRSALLICAIFRVTCNCSGVSTIWIINFLSSLKITYLYKFKQFHPVLSPLAYLFSVSPTTYFAYYFSTFNILYSTFTRLRRRKRAVNNMEQEGAGWGKKGKKGLCGRDQLRELIKGVILSRLRGIIRLVSLLWCK